MNLFEMKDGMLSVSLEALGIKVFKKIWDRNKKAKKSIVFEEFSYIYFFCDFKSDFADIVDEEEREKEIIDAVMGTDSKWKPDALIKEAMEVYVERSSTITSTMLDDAKSAVSKISKFLKNIDLEEKDDRGKLIHNAKNIAGVIGDMSNIVENIDKLEQKVKKEQQEASNMKGNRKKSIFEDGIL